MHRVVFKTSTFIVLLYLAQWPLRKHKEAAMKWCLIDGQKSCCGTKRGLQLGSVLNSFSLLAFRTKRYTLQLYMGTVGAKTARLPWELINISSPRGLNISWSSCCLTALHSRVAHPIIRSNIPWGWGCMWDGVDWRPAGALAEVTVGRARVRFAAFYYC